MCTSLIHERCEFIINELVKLDFSLVNKEVLANKITLDLLGEDGSINPLRKRLFETRKGTVRDEIEEALEELKRKKIISENHNGFIIKTCKELF